MDNIKIEYLPIKDLKPYERNAKKHDETQIKNVMESIKQFGFAQPLVVDKDNVLIIGHCRLIAAKRLKLKEVPVVRMDELTQEQVDKLRLLDNKLNESEWDFDLLAEDIPTLDFSDFDIDWGLPEEQEENTDDLEPEDDDSYYGDERERTNRAYNLDILDPDNLTNDFWQMPIIENNGYIPNDLIGFNYAKTSKNKNAGIHFYIDDYQFERIWNYPEKYIDVLKEYGCILTPDFSLYMDMPMPMKIWNVYRSRLIGTYYQSMGFNVIPTISWAEPATFEFCFKGIPKGSIVSISTIGVKRDKDALKIWGDGVTEMIKQIEPSAILVYGGALEYDYGNIKVVYFENKVTENWR